MIMSKTLRLGMLLINMEAELTSGRRRRHLNGMRLHTIPLLNGYAQMSILVRSAIIRIKSLKNLMNGFLAKWILKSMVKCLLQLRKLFGNSLLKKMMKIKIIIIFLY